MRAYHVRIVLHLPPSKSQKTKTDAFIPLSLWQPLPTHTRKSTARRNATFNPRGKDYRLGPIALDWVDLDNMTATPFPSQGRADPKGEFTDSSPFRSDWVELVLQELQLLPSFLRVTQNRALRIFPTVSSMSFATPSGKNSPRRTREHLRRMPIA